MSGAAASEKQATELLERISGGLNQDSATVLV